MLYYLCFDIMIVGLIFIMDFSLQMNILVPLIIWILKWHKFMHNCLKFITQIIKDINKLKKALWTEKETTKILAQCARLSSLMDRSSSKTAHVSTTKGIPLIQMSLQGSGCKIRVGKDSNQLWLVMSRTWKYSRWPKAKDRICHVLP
jgi:hypothetical protein